MSPIQEFYPSNELRQKMKSLKKSRKRQQTNNKSKEVQHWDDIDNIVVADVDEREHQESTQEFVQESRVKTKYMLQELRSMKWGDLDELSEDELGCDIISW